MAQSVRVFVSATSGDLGSYRRAVRDTLLTRGVFPEVQDNSPPDYRAVVEMLRDRINGCDAVICLVGFCYGAEPQHPPADRPRRSYTQLEFEIAVALEKPVYVFLADQACPVDEHAEEPEELRGLQLEHRDRLMGRDELWRTFKSVEHLTQQVAAIPFPGLGDGSPRKPQNLPHASLGTLFKGREGFLAALRSRLEGSPGWAAAVVATQAIHGLGGIGKSRLAVEYAWHRRADYTALLFVVADSPESLSRNLAALAAPGVLDLSEHAAPEEEVRLAAVLRWLESRPGWLLILDNVDTEEAARAVESLLASLRAGHVVITSRLGNWGQGVDPLELDVLDEGPSTAFLLERTDRRRRATPDDESDARTLARELDGLALALEQAGAYVAHQRCSLADYLARWRDHEPRVVGWHDARLMQYPRSVAVTWETTLAQLTPPARALLNLLSWLAPDPIPVAMFRGTEAVGLVSAGFAGPGARGAIRRCFANVARIWGRASPHPEDALANLAAYSMLKWDEPGELFSVHRVVQQISRHRTPEPDRPFWIEQTLKMVDGYAQGDPMDVRTWPVWEPLQTHAAAIVAHADAAGITDPTSWLMTKLGVLLQRRCRLREAETLYRRALAIDEGALGPDHPDVAVDLRSLALLLRATNRLGEAEPLMRRALAIDEAALGPEHPNLAADLNALALLFFRTNRLAEAEPLMRRALEIDEAAFGPDHPNVAIRLNNLAQLLQATNRLAEAEPLVRRALEIDDAAFGPDHPAVASKLSNLAWLLYRTNRLAEAEPLMRRALAIDEAAFGPDHPKVAIRLNNLAQLLQATNRLAEAEPFMRRAVLIRKDFREATGHEHPHWRAAIGNYTGLLEAMGLGEEEIRRRLEEVGGG